MASQSKVSRGLAKLKKKMYSRVNNTYYSIAKTQFYTCCDFTRLLNFLNMLGISENIGPIEIIFEKNISFKVYLG